MALPILLKAYIDLGLSSRDDCRLNPYVGWPVVAAPLLLQPPDRSIDLSTGEVSRPSEKHPSQGTAYGGGK